MTKILRLLLITTPAAVMLPTTITYNPNEGYHLRHGVAEYCYVTPAQPENLSVIINNMVVKPLFSIVVPVYNTPLDLLHELIESIEAQWYPQWELILANDCSTDPQLYDVLKVSPIHRSKLFILKRIAVFPVQRILLLSMQRGIILSLRTMMTS
jgi:hypothetical protein